MREAAARAEAGRTWSRSRLAALRGRDGARRSLESTVAGDEEVMREPGPWFWLGETGDDGAEDDVIITAGNRFFFCFFFLSCFLFLVFLFLCGEGGSAIDWRVGKEIKQENSGSWAQYTRRRHLTMNSAAAGDTAVETAAHVSSRRRRLRAFEARAVVFSKHCEIVQKDTEKHSAKETIQTLRDTVRKKTRNPQSRTPPPIRPAISY